MRCNECLTAHITTAPTRKEKHGTTLIGCKGTAGGQSYIKESPVLLHLLSADLHQSHCKVGPSCAVPVQSIHLLQHYSQLNQAGKHNVLPRCSLMPAKIKLDLITSKKQTAQKYSMPWMHIAEWSNNAQMLKGPVLFYIHCMDCNNLNILWNIWFCVPQKKLSHTVLKRQDDGWLSLYLN